MDWVQNEDSYSPNFTAMNAEFTAAAIAPLVYSAQSYTMGNVGAEIVSVNRAAALPQWQKRQVVRAVRGSIECAPIEIWTSNSSRHWGFRIAKFLADPGDANAIVPLHYNMYGASGVGPDEETGPYIYADAPFLWEHRMVKYYSPDHPAPHWRIPVSWSGRCVLEENEMLAMYIEGDASFGVTSLNVRTWLRCLVEVPSS